MDVRFLTDTDYDDTLVKWWQDWRWTAPPKDMLPEDGKCGMMVSKDGENICAGFLYFTNSKTAWLEYIVSNFEYKNKDRHEAIELLINMLSELAKDKGIKYIYTSLKSKSLIKKYENCGFITGDNNCQEMIKIWQQ
jgi:hypothetical protein